QAEDGIRDFHVTGVQTCALPIFTTRGRRCPFFLALWPKPKGTERRTAQVEVRALRHGRLLAKEPRAFRRSIAAFSFRRRAALSRSEERRVGKECTAR